jgi:hypothetical protein
MGLSGATCFIRERLARADLMVGSGLLAELHGLALERILLVCMRLLLVSFAAAL